MFHHARVAVAGFAALVAILAIVAVVQEWTPAGWSALAAWTTVGIATLAGTVAVRQLGLAEKVRLEQQRSRSEQAQPNVVAYIEPSAASSVLIDLVVRNFGVTPAHQVRLDITPKPRRAIDKNASDPHMWLPQQIPVLVPGQ